MIQAFTSRTEKLLSRYRISLMGLATLGVMLFHLGRIPVMDYPWAPLSVAARESFWWGVDIFLFLSGLGCFYSLKEHGTYQFYIRRFWRIIPVILIAGCLKCLWSDTSFQWTNINDLRRLLCFDQWYIVTYLILIACYPLLDKALRFGKTGIILLCAAIVLLPILAMVILPQPIYHLGCISWTITRAPAFIIGAWLGYQYTRNNDILQRYSIPTHICWICIMIAIYFTLHQTFGKTGFATDTPINLIIFVSLLPSFCYLFTLLLDWMQAHLLGKWSVAVLSAWGLMSLELYLVHEFVYGKTLHTIPVDWTRTTFIAFTFSISLFIAFLLSKSTAALVNILRPGQSRKMADPPTTNSI